MNSVLWFSEDETLFYRKINHWKVLPSKTVTAATEMHSELMVKSDVYLTLLRKHPLNAIDCNSCYEKT